MNRQQRRSMERALSKKAINPEQVADSKRILQNILHIIDTAEYRGAKNAPLVAEAFNYVQMLISTLPEVKDEAPTSETVSEDAPNAEATDEAVPQA